MRRQILILTGVLTCFQVNAQFFGRKSLVVSQGAIFFNAPSLNNKNNANNKTSWISEIDKNLYLSRFASFNLGGGVGNYKNPDDRFESYQSTNFYRFKFALMVHLPSLDKCTQCTPKPNLVSPFLMVGYNFDLLSKTFKAIGDERVSSNMKVGGGAIVRVSNQVGVKYEFTLNQRINSDYRTFYQHSLGMVINLEKK